MAQTRFAPDRGLIARMGLTMFLLGIVYTAFIVALIALFWRGGGWIWVVVIAAGLLAVQFLFSDKIALAAMRGRVVTREQAPQLHATIDRLCAMADMPKPQVAISDSAIPNAFAIGRSPKKAVVCASGGMMRQLDQQELEAVLAHELSHVAHRDVAVMTIASFLGILAGMIARMAFWGMAFGGGNRDQSGAVVAMAMMAMVLIGVLVYAISFLLIRALSRYRELAADRSGVMLTGRPSALASALQKVSGQVAGIPNKDLRKAEAYNAFFFAPLKSKGLSFSTIFSTHPSLEKRLQQLAEISSQLGEVTPAEQRGPGGYDQVPGIDPTGSVQQGEGRAPVSEAPAAPRQHEPGATSDHPHAADGYRPPGAR